MEISNKFLNQKKLMSPICFETIKLLPWYTEWQTVNTI